MLYFFENELFCDLWLESKNNFVPCHKAVLAASSDHLNDYLRKSESNVFEFNKVTATVIRTALLFLYRGFCEITPENVCDLLYVADVWNIDDLKNECLSFMITTETIENCLKYYEECLKRRCDTIVLDLQAKYIFGILAELAETDELTNLSTSVLYDLLLRGRTLKLQQDDVLFDVILKHHEKNPAVDCTDLIQTLCFSKMCKRYLRNVVLESPILTDDMRDSIFSTTKDLCNYVE